jgi:hypothetical protein
MSFHGPSYKFSANKLFPFLTGFCRLSHGMFMGVAQCNSKLLGNKEYGNEVNALKSSVLCAYFERWSLGSRWGCQPVTKTIKKIYHTCTMLKKMHHACCQKQ